VQHPPVELSRRRALAALAALAASSLLARRPLAAGSRSSADAQALLAAVVAGELARVQSLLAAQPELARATDAQGRSAFVLAHLHGHVEIAQALRACGLELDLVEAFVAEDWKRVEELAAAEPATLERAHAVGGTPLYAGALVGSLDMHRLRSLGCKPDLAPSGGSGYTPARGALESARPGWALIALCDLLGNGADPNAPQRAGSSILHGAVLRRDEALVRVALRKGAAPEARDDAGHTPRELALELGWSAGAQLLQEHARVPRDNRSSRFALDARREPVQRPGLSDVPQALQNRITGSSHGKLAAVRELVGSDQRLVFSVSTDDELAIEACAHTGARPIIRYHLELGAPLSLPTAVSLGDFESVRFWLARDPTLIHERGAHDFPLMWLALLGEEREGEAVAMAELLIQHGAAADQETMGTTALHLCAKHDVRDLAAYLLERGADPRARGSKFHKGGRTPLEMALEEGHTQLAEMLRNAQKG
jgi:ankyrin repeat protein